MFFFVLCNVDKTDTASILVSGISRFLIAFFILSGHVHQLRQVLYDVQRLWLPSHHLRQGHSPPRGNERLHGLHTLPLRLPHPGVHTDGPKEDARHSKKRNSFRANGIFHEDSFSRYCAVRRFGDARIGRFFLSLIRVPKGELGTTEVSERKSLF